MNSYQARNRLKQKAPSFGGGLFLHAITTCGAAMTHAPIAPRPGGCSHGPRPTLHYCRGCRRGHNYRFSHCGLWTQGAKPASREPRARYHEFRPPAIEANLDVGGGRHGRMAQRAWTVAEKPDLCGNYGQSGRLALWTNHKTPREVRKHGFPNESQSGETQCNVNHTTISTGNQQEERRLRH